MTEYRWDNRCPDLEFARLEAGFTGYDFTNFARVLLAGYARAEADVHVLTGRLKASGRATVDEASSTTWSGEISFGGGDVRWAASEFFGYSLKHGGYPTHAYFRALGWQPQPRSGAGSGPVQWAMGPIRDFDSGGGGPEIDEDMQGPATSFLSRGRNTPHPEGPIHDDY